MGQLPRGRQVYEDSARKPEDDAVINRFYVLD
jgi:hypothetical protein